MTQEEIAKYDAMIEYGVATEAELKLARNLVSGTWNEVLDAVCNVRTGFRTFEQYFAEEIDTNE